MIRLTELLREAFQILGRNIVLMYPFFFFLLILSLLIPQTSETPQLDTKWVALFSILFLFYTAFQAGWFAMMYVAVQKWLHPKDPQWVSEMVTTGGQKLPLPDTFVIFKAFLPGVGQFFFRYVVGGLLHVAIIVTFLMGTHFLVEQTMGYPPLLLKLATMIHIAGASAANSVASTSTPTGDPVLQQQLLTPTALQQMILKLPAPQLEQLNSFLTLLLGMFCSYTLVYFLTMFWPQFVISQNVGVFKAYWLSIQQFFKRPFLVLGMGISYLATFMVLKVLFPFEDPIISILLQIMTILATVYYAILFFLLVIKSEVNTLQVTVMDSSPPSVVPPSSSSGSSNSSS